MSQCLCRRVPILNGVREQGSDKSHGLIGHVPKEFVGKGVFALDDGCLDGLVVLAVKRRCSAQKHVDNDTQTPQIACLGVGLFEDLRSNVVGGTNHTRESFSGAVVRRETKVNEFEGTPYVLSRFQHPVLEFQITVANATRMQKGDRRKHFGYGLGGISLGDSVLGVGGEEVKEIPAPSQLRYYKELVVHTKDVVQTDDVVVSPELPENIDFLLELGNVLWVVPEHDALAGKLFSLPASVGTQMPLGLSPGGDADLSVGTFSNDQISVQQIGGSPLG
mmetsp:Transcript_4416/g.9237  ORF Transcript_4416/g.9237 Transcript_4416/m.9237 type:complete len:277 (-) Transcript_4416:614-1444(-)